jgi:quinol monooxygenase YgiN
MKTRTLILTVILAILGVACKTKSPEPQGQTEPAVITTDYQKMIIAKVFIKSGSESDFISAAKVMIENSNKEEGCLGYMLYQDPYEKTNFIFVEKYKNQVAIDFHFATSYFKEFGEKISGITSNPTEIKIIDIAGEK